MENMKSNNKYIIKNLGSWMVDELIAFSQIVNFEIIFLRKQDEFYEEEIEQLLSNGITIYNVPKSFNNLFKKIYIALKFTLNNIFKFRFDKNSIFALKSILWFLKLDMTKFSEKSEIHAQYATQASIVSLLIKQYFNDIPKYSFTFHAHDIYFNNKWFNILVDNCYKAFSISNYNIDYISNYYKKSNKICLSRLGVDRNLITKKKKRENMQSMFLILA